MLWYTTGSRIHFRYALCHCHIRMPACSNPPCLRKATKTQGTAAHSEHSSKLREHKLLTDNVLEIQELAMTLKICSKSSLSCATNNHKGSWASSFLYQTNSESILRNSPMTEPCLNNPCMMTFKTCCKGFLNKVLQT